MTQFNADLEANNELEIVADALTPPEHTKYMRIQTRIDTFANTSWLEQPVSRNNLYFQKPEFFAKAGFFYMGEADHVACFWCGLELVQWEPIDIPLYEHVRHRPQCPWIIRILGRQRAELLYMKTKEAHTVVPPLQTWKPADCAFQNDVADISAGALYRRLVIPVQFFKLYIDSNCNYLIIL